MRKLIAIIVMIGALASCEYFEELIQSQSYAIIDRETKVTAYRNGFKLPGFRSRHTYSDSAIYDACMWSSNDTLGEWLEFNPRDSVGGTGAHISHDGWIHVHLESLSGRVNWDGTLKLNQQP